MTKAIFAIAALSLASLAAPAFAESYSLPAQVDQPTFLTEPVLPPTYGPPAPVEAVPSQPQAVTEDDRSFMEKLGPRKFAAHSIAAGLDAYSTYRCSHLRARPNGRLYSKCVEANPLLKKIFGKHLSKGDALGAFAVMQVIYVGGSVGMGEATGYDSQATKIFQVSLIGAHGIAAGANFRF